MLGFAICMAQCFYDYTFYTLFWVPRASAASISPLGPWWTRLGRFTWLFRPKFLKQTSLDTGIARKKEKRCLIRIEGQVV